MDAKIIAANVSAKVQRFASRYGGPYIYNASQGNLTASAIRAQVAQMAAKFGGSPTMSPTQTSVRIWWDASVSAYRLSSSYNKDLVDALKSQIPASDRSMDSRTKIWTFTEKWLTPIQATIKLINAQLTLITRAQAEQARVGATGAGAGAGSSSRRPIDAVIVDFVKLLPYDAAQSAYRKAAMLLHPDRGGSMESMSALNAVWERIQKEVFNQ